MDLTTLTDEELLRLAHTEFDALTSSALEAELLRRFGALIDQGQEHAPLLDVLSNRGIDTGDELDKQLVKAQAVDERINGIALLDVLLDFDYDDPEALRKQLDRIQKFDQAMQDLAEPLATLQTLATA